MNPEERDARAVYADCDGQGEMLATYKEEHLCFNCQLSGVCVVADATTKVESLAVVVSRCAAYVGGDV